MKVKIPRMFCFLHPLLVAKPLGSQGTTGHLNSPSLSSFKYNFLHSVFAPLRDDQSMSVSHMTLIKENIQESFYVQHKLGIFKVNFENTMNPIKIYPHMLKCFR